MTKKIPITRNVQGRLTFEQIHKAGSEHHGISWLIANDRAVQACMGIVDVSDQDVKHLVSFICFKILDGLYANNLLREKCKEKK